MHVTRTAVRTIAVAVLSVGMWSGAMGVAAASADDAESDVSVSVPSATPTPTPKPPFVPVPNNPPPAAGGTTPPAANRGGGSGAANPASAAPSAPATEPPISPQPASNAGPMTADRETYTTGENVTIRMEGLTPGEQVQIVLYPGGRLIGNVAAGADGVLAHTFALPADLTTGTHTVQATGWASKKIGAVQIFVTAADATSSVAGTAQGVPVWVWWVGGGLGAVLLAVGGWWILGAMRTPEPATATV